MGKHTLYYFNVKARAEVIRLVLHAANIDFEDVRIEQDKWPEYKKKSPSGQAPWLETADGKGLTQSMAIARKFAYENDMLGKNGDELFEIEKSIDQVTDVKEEIYKLFFIADAEEKEKKKKELVDGKGDTILTMIDKDIAKNKGFLCIAGKVTLADLYLLTLIDFLKDLVPELMEKHSGLNAYYDNICKACPRVGDWIKKRPVTKL